MTEAMPNDFICMRCAGDQDNNHQGGMATWHIGPCSVCHEIRVVTQVRDFRITQSPRPPQE